MTRGQQNCVKTPSRGSTAAAALPADDNWGIMAMAALAAVATYRNDVVLLAEVRRIFDGWLGDRDEYAGFQYGDLCWQPDRADPTSDCDLVTPGTQCEVGACPDRVCALGGRIPSNTYIHGALSGAVVCAEILSRRGYADVYRWESAALQRAAQWLLDRHADDPAMGWWFSGNDTFVPWLLNRAYGTSFPTAQNTNVGRNMDSTDWTHAPQ